MGYIRHMSLNLPSLVDPEKGWRQNLYDLPLCRLSCGTFHIAEHHKSCIHEWMHKEHKEHSFTRDWETSVMRSTLTTEDVWLNYTSLKAFCSGIKLRPQMLPDIQGFFFPLVMSPICTHSGPDYHICLLTVLWVDPSSTGANVTMATKPSYLFQLAKCSFKSQLCHEVFLDFPKPVVSSSSSGSRY